MIIDTHIHVWSYPALADARDHIKSTKDLVSFRSRCPDLYDRTLTEHPIDNSDQLIADMDEFGIDKAFVQARPGSVTNDQVALSVERHPDRLYGLMRIGHDQEAAYEYMEDPAPVRDSAADEVAHCIEDLGMIGLGEIFIRAMTAEVDPEKIAKDLVPMMDAVNHYKVPVQFPTAWSQFPGGLFYGHPVWADEVAARYPEVPIILTKMGRSLITYFEPCMAVGMRNENVYFDVVGTNADHLRQALDLLGSERIMFGSDWSATWSCVREPVPLYTMRLKVLEDANCTEEERENILWRNAARLFKLNDIAN
jgi:predicted TIM-barrel fold metal-dependent hydrolase